ncbi:MAG: hypothetical protein ACREX0_09990 [Noviherbaspirillum sp.]
MANREELLIIRAARAGQASAQLTLGKRYLFGGAGLPKSLVTALYWLDRAAQQDEQDAWLLIGRHVPFETVQQAAHPSKLYVWYERAFDAGVAQAGLVLAKLVLGQADGAVSEAMRSKALRALQAAAHAGIAEAQWMLAQSLAHADLDPMGTWPSAAAADNEAMLQWATRAARSGVAEAQYALADHAWAGEDRNAFLRWALPLARRLVEHGAVQTGAVQARDLGLVMRCAHVLAASPDADAGEVSRLLEFAAQSGNRDAQFSLGLRLARMDLHGKRNAAIPGVASYKKAIRWLSLSAEQGSADAMHALSRIYTRPECSQRNLADAQRYLEMAAHAGHGVAQFELGAAAWRARREQESNDVRAVWWLQQAQAQGIAEAGELLVKIATPATPAAWAQAALPRVTREVRDMHPRLTARIEAAAVFGLTRTEALLIDLKAADRGHCLAVDIRAQHPHSRRRLVVVSTASERQALDNIMSLFERAGAGANEAEGNYRQRAYRLKALLPEY